MDYILLQRVLNIIKLQLWHKSNRRICIRGYMICCDSCNKEYIKEFDGFICVRLFYLRKSVTKSRFDVPKLKKIFISYNLINSELDIIIKLLNRFYNVSLYKNKKRIKIEERD